MPYTEKGESLASLIEGNIEDIPGHMLIGETEKQKKFQTSMADFAKDFSKCIVCKNCRDMCPVCYCIDCVFNGDEYLPKGDALLNKIYRTGSGEMPQGKEMFHRSGCYHVYRPALRAGRARRLVLRAFPLQSTSRAYRNACRMSSPICRVEVSMKKYLT